MKVVINDESISCLITCLPDWVRPLPRDGLGDQICEFSHVEDDADGRGRGHENGEDGFLRGPWDETVHQVRTRPLVALHQPGHLETVVNHIQGIPGDTDRTIATCKDTGQSDGGHAWHRKRGFLHESPLKKQPEHEAAGVCPPEGASDREPPLPQSLQLLFLAFIAVDTDSTRTLWRTMTHDGEESVTVHF